MKSTLTKIALMCVTAGSIAACTTSPGGYTGELQPLNVAGHDVRTTFAAAWMKECLGQPDDVAMMLTQFEHVPGAKTLRHIATGTVLSEGDCDKVFDLLGSVVVADAIRAGGDTFNNSADATNQNQIGVNVNSGWE